MDKIQLEILEDGTISVKTSEISETNHLSADELLKMISEMSGGTTKITPREHEFWEKRTVKKGGKIKVGE